MPRHVPVGLCPSEDQVPAWPLSLESYAFAFDVFSNNHGAKGSGRVFTQDLCFGAGPMQDRGTFPAPAPPQSQVVAEQERKAQV